MRTNHKYRVNMEIPAVFIATLLHFGLPKDKTKKLCRKLSKEDLLGGLRNVLENIDENLTIPLPNDFNVTIKMGNLPQGFPFYILRMKLCLKQGISS